MFQNVLVLLGVLQSPGLVKNEECVKERGAELTDAEGRQDLERAGKNQHEENIRMGICSISCLTSWTR